MEDANYVVATPGRMIDYLRTEAYSVSDVGFLTLDEADRMLDLGFEEQVR